MSAPHPVYIDRLAKVLKQGEFIPSKPGALSFGYDLWARHENGDVILHCGGNAGWFDWFTPVKPGDAPDFELTIDGRQYRLVRGVDAVPSTFVTRHELDKRHGGTIAQAQRASQIRRVGRPVKATGPVAPPAPVVHSSWERPYRIEQLEPDGVTWTDMKDAHRTLHLAAQAGDRYYRHHGHAHRVVYRGREVVHEWRPTPLEGASA